MTPGQTLVFWCVILGFVIVFLAEVVRAIHRAPGLGRTPRARLRDELDREADNEH